MQNTGVNHSIMDNAIYEGLVKHRRYVGQDHAFGPSLYMLWIKVSDVDSGAPFHPMISRARFAPISVVGGDYMAHRPESALRERLSGEIFQKTKKQWSGAAMMLAQPRHFGFVINPLAVFYCYGDAGDLQFVVGEITNTPWGERHCYVFEMGREATERSKKFAFKKEFHVSPFLPMDMNYTWNINKPGETINIGIWNKVADRLDFEAHLTLRRKVLSVASLVLCMIKMPLMTWKILIGIYLNAGILFAVKRVKFYGHPKLNAKETMELDKESNK